MGFLREPAVWIVILVVILLFGAKRLPDVARGLGRSLRVFKAETDGLRTDGATVPADPATPVAPPAPLAAPAPVQATPVAPPAPVAPAPVAPAQQAAAPAPRYLVDPLTGEQILAQPVTPPADGAPRS
jgi:sec-independent protein translocase protein TatA